MRIPAVVVYGLLLLCAATAHALEKPIGADTGKRFVAAINTADAAAFNDMLDADAIAAHVLGGIAPDALERTGFQNVLSSKYSMLGWSLSGQFTAGKARAKLVSATDGEALVRVTMGEPGDLAHSYMRLKVGASGKIEDWYDYALAMSMSEQLRFSAASEIPFTTLVAMLFGRSDDAATVAKFKSFATHVVQGN